jgi:hypothetical protein
MIEQYEMAKRLRELLKDTQRSTDPIPAHKIMDLADEYQAEAEKIELSMIVQAQRDQYI